MSPDYIYSTSTRNFFLIAGPCLVESKDLCFEVAGKVKDLCKAYDIPYIFKSSYRKANRSRGDAFIGIGDELALEILGEVNRHFQVPVTTDIHSDPEAALAAQYVDVLQIPAFLCRQTSLLEAAARTGKTVNIKKGQFMSAEAMKHAVQKVVAQKNESVWLTDRGNSFGYNDLIVDFRNIPIMRSFNVPVIMDCTHSLQRPNLSSGGTGGSPEYISTIAKAAIAVGADGLFIETHPEPAIAKSDGANMLPLNQLDALLDQLTKIRRAIHLND